MNHVTENPGLPGKAGLDRMRLQVMANVLSLILCVYVKESY